MSSKLDFSKELSGRRALVTAGARGMGAAIAQRLVDAGAKVAVTGRSCGDAAPAEAIFIAGDVSSVEGVNAIAAKAVGALGGLDILVNVAGGARPPRKAPRRSPKRNGRHPSGSTCLPPSV